jgi:hypothetical protein
MHRFFKFGPCTVLQVCHIVLHLELGRQWKVIVFHMYFVNRRVCIFNTKICMEMALENFTRKMCYDYFQAYDITLICSLFVRILYFNYMLYY